MCRESKCRELSTQERSEMTRPAGFAFAVAAAALLTPVWSHAQLFTLTKDQMVELTAQNPFERFPDGRPKVPDVLMERAKGLSAEEVFTILSQARSEEHTSE